MPKVFISYRRQDSQDVTGRMAEHVERRFGLANLFMDVDSIPPGVDFRQHLSRAVGGCDVLLAVIGRDWVAAADEQGRRRLDDAADFVRIEIEAALAQGIAVIPVLVHGASMPSADQLPESLKELAFRQAVHVRPDPDFRNDIQRLLQALERVPARPAPGQERQPVSPWAARGDEPSLIGSAMTLGPAPPAQQPGGEPAADWIGQVLSAGRYEVVALLGQGGMGAVYRAQDKRLQREVVIKVPHADLLRRPGFAERFAREIHALVELSHPHVCPIHDVDEHAGTPFAVLKYLGGGSLEARRPKDAQGRPTPVPLADFQLWLAHVAQALDFIHGRGHVHRDIKPSNILFDDAGNVYLSDLGIAKAMAAEAQSPSLATLTESGVLVGTPAYMPHEVLVGQPYGPRADQYALAVVVYELLTGRRPFEGLTPTAIGIQQATTTPLPPHTLATGLTEGVSTAVLTGLSKVPVERFGSCVDLVRAIVKGRKQQPAAPPRPVPPPAQRVGRAEPREARQTEAGELSGAPRKLGTALPSGRAAASGPARCGAPGPNRSGAAAPGGHGLHRDEDGADSGGRVHDGEPRVARGSGPCLCRPQYERANIFQERVSVS